MLTNICITHTYTHYIYIYICVLLNNVHFYAHQKTGVELFCTSDRGRFVGGGGQKTGQFDYELCFCARSDGYQRFRNIMQVGALGAGDNIIMSPRPHVCIMHLIWSVDAPRTRVQRSSH